MYSGSTVSKGAEATRGLWFSFTKALTIKDYLSPDSRHALELLSTTYS